MKSSDAFGKLFNDHLQEKMEVTEKEVSIDEGKMTTFPMFVEALKLEAYSGLIWKGLICSIGGLTVSTVSIFR